MHLSHTALLTFVGSGLISPAIAAGSELLPWPYNLPAHVKYYPEDETHVNRNNEVEQRLATQAPAGVQKMSEDEGEKFFLDYWVFESSNESSQSDASNTFSSSISTPTSTPSSSLRQRAADTSNSLLYANASIPFTPPFLRHTNDNENTLDFKFPPLRYLPRNALSVFQRGFQCPAGTNNCASIGRPDSCCAVGETCQLITNTGLGDVGCCAQGQTCTGQITTCEAGYSSCPNFPGGGCCIPNYTCLGSGCAYIGTTTVLTTSTSTVRTIATPSYIPPSSSSSSSSASSSPASSPVVPITTSSTPPTTSPPSHSQTPLTCSGGYKSCPATLGGGCCPSSRLCGFAECPPSSTASGSSSSVGAGPPIRPTSITSTSPSSTPSTSSSSTSSPTGVCPTGFYMCSAYYLGGCCRVGRNCDTTSCPASSSSTALESNGVSVVVATGTGTATGTAAATGATAAGSGSGSSSGPQETSNTCATGWFKCASSAGGGCCPSGFACGKSSCTTSGAGGVSDVGKMSPSATGGGNANGSTSGGSRTIVMEFGFGLVVMVVLCVIVI